MSTTLFNLINGVSGIVIDKINPNLHFTNNKYISNSSYITTDTAMKIQIIQFLYNFFYDPSKKVDIAVTRSNYKQYPRFAIDKTLMWIADGFHRLSKNDYSILIS